MATKKKSASKETAPDPAGTDDAFEAAMEDFRNGVEHFNARSWREANEAFSSVLSRGLDEPALLHRARTYSQICARSLAEAAPEPTDGDELYYRGVVAANDRRLDEALQDLDRAAAVTTAPKVLYARASVRALRGESDAAVLDLRKAVSADPILRFQAVNDPDFDRIRDEAAFIDLVEPTPTEV